VQGCSLNCQGCFNPQTHNKDAGKEMEIRKIIEEIRMYRSEKSIIGVTITGGEPFQQVDDLLELVSGIKKYTNLGIIILTGYSKGELMKFSQINSITKNVDLIIAGRYNNKLKLKSGLRGSSNKKYWYTSEFYKKHIFDDIPDLEIITNENGEITISGIDPGNLNQKL
jgi:anaerobic ribonucleoside-triphosphate reductase activating protein